MDNEATLRPDELLAESSPCYQRRLARSHCNFPCLVTVDGPSLGERFSLRNEQVVIGRRSDVDIRIVDPLASRRHAQVVVKQGAIILQDLRSKNGTFCNNERIQEKVLGDGDLIQIGGTTLKYLGPNNIEHHYLMEMSERASRDGLTGLYNRQTFDHLLERYLSRFHDIREPITVALLDLDFFKQINDHWGHGAGDSVLKEFAVLVKNGIRPSDLMARIGGEEFGIILPHTTLMEARRVGDRIRECVNKHSFVFCGQTLPVTVSIGIAERTIPAATVEVLLERADKALYQAKREGRNRIGCFTESY